MRRAMIPLAESVLLAAIPMALGWILHVPEIVVLTGGGAIVLARIWVANRS